MFSLFCGVFGLRWAHTPTHHPPQVDLNFTEAAMIRYDGLRTQKLNVGANDLKIAAIALEHGLIVVTRNQRDYDRVPALVTENWSHPQEA